MDAVTALGTAAGTLTTIALLPQVLRILRTRSARDISAWSFVTLSAGLALWALYGLLIDSLPVILFNTATLVLALAVLVLKTSLRGD